MRDSLLNSIPWVSRRAFALEAAATLLFAFALSFLEGGTVGIFLKQTFLGTISPGAHNYAVALIGSSAELANLVSFGWIAAARGKPRVRFINSLQLGMCLCLAGVALVPINAAGLWITVVLVVSARICWSGIVTLRTSVWRQNYPREVRSRAIGRFAIITQLAVAAGGFLIGASLDLERESFRVLAPVLATIACGGLFFYSRIRVRGERAALEQERADARQTAGRMMRPWEGIFSTWRILRNDRRYAQFMGFMFLLGMGNLMVVPLVSIALHRRFDLGDAAARSGVFVTSTLPNLLMPLSVPLWAALLDRSHVVRFRAWHGWAFVLAVGFFLSGFVFQAMPLVYAGSVCWGIALGGGSLAWNLGHTDFAPPSLNSHYMATHVTLNGLRGVIAPAVAATLFNAFTSWHVPDPGSWVLAVSLVFTIAGCLGFVWLRHSMGQAVATHTRSGISSERAGT